MRGIVLCFNQDKGFGFARPDGGGEDVWLHVSNLANRADKAKLVKDAQIDSELGTAEEGKKRPALRIRILDAPAAASASPQTATTATAAAAPPAAAPTTPQRKMAKYDPDKISVQFLEVTLSGLYLLVKVWANESSLLLRAYLEGNDESRQEGFADAEGNAEFTILVPKGWEDNTFLQVCVVVVYEGDQTSAPWRHTWRNPAKPAETAAEAPKADAAPAPDKPAHLTVTPTAGFDRMNFQVRTTTGAEKAAKLVPATIVIRSESGAELRARAAGSKKWKQGSVVELPCTGNATVQMQWTIEISGDNVFLGIKDGPEQAGPFYVSGYFRAPSTGA